MAAASNRDPSAPDPSNPAPAAPLREVLSALGYLEDPEAGETPERVYSVLLAFAPGKPPPPVSCCAGTSRDPLMLKGARFHSLCVHHLLPFFGEADIGHLPDGKIAGLGELARALRHFSRQPQIQERLTADLAGFLQAELGGSVVVRIRARHLCLEMRGIEGEGTFETLARRGPETDALMSMF